MWLMTIVGTGNNSFGVYPWTHKRIFMLQPMVLTPSKSSHLKVLMSDHMEM